MTAEQVAKWKAAIASHHKQQRRQQSRRRDQPYRPGMIRRLPPADGDGDGDQLASTEGGRRTGGPSLTG